MICSSALFVLFGVLGAAAPSAPRTETSARRAPWREVGGFVGLSWRLMGLANHVSHGPGFEAGVILFNHVALGVAGISRPGAINPKTFEYELPDGQTYRGQRRLRLRSDGGGFGLFVAPFYDLRRLPLSLELPILVGSAGFGFYLAGDDRDVPDGRRVSAWENELLEGADSDTASVLLDVGFRIAWTPRNRYVRPFVGVHYSWILGYQTTLVNNYDGFSGVLGVKFGKF